MAKPSVFDYVNEINNGKQNLLALDPTLKSSYNSFMVNRALSQHHETVLPAQIMNFYHELDKDMQMEYLIQSIPKGKRFAKWAKEDKYEYLETIIQWYQCSKAKALEIIELLDVSEVTRIHKILNDRGGLVKK